MGQPLNVQPQCHACLARERCIFGDLPAPRVERFSPIRDVHQYKPRQPIFHEGTPALGFHSGCGGLVKLSQADRNGGQQIIRIAGPGEVVGEEALLEGRRYIATAEALDARHIAFIKREEFLALLNEGSHAGARFLLHFCRTLIEAQECLARMGLGDARARLAATLLDLAGRHGKPVKGRVHLDLGLSRAELAAMAGLSPETAMRLLGEFKADGLIQLDGPSITLVDRDQLAAAVTL